MHVNCKGCWEMREDFGVYTCAQLIECAANLALQGGVKSADANGVLSAVNRAFAVVRCTGG